MYQILKNGEAIAETDRIDTAIKIIRMLEIRINRLKQHSPYTIQKG